MAEPLARGPTGAADRRRGEGSPGCGAPARVRTGCVIAGNNGTQRLPRWPDRRRRLGLTSPPRAQFTGATAQTPFWQPTLSELQQSAVVVHLPPTFWQVKWLVSTHVP